MRCGHCSGFAGSIDEIRVHQRKCNVDPRWREVMEARLAGHDGVASRIARRILGVAEPMTEEAKEKLRAWAVDHKDEIRHRQKIKRSIRRALKAKTRARS